MISDIGVKGRELIFDRPLPENKRKGGRVILAGERSGCGKTSVACALIRTLSGRGERVRAFKCGPDYIDPRLHEAAGALRGSSLDSYLMRQDSLSCLLRAAKERGEFSLIEGVMGYHDGIGMSDEASTHRIAYLTGTPVIMVMDCSGSLRTALARLKGLAEFAPDGLVRGVIFNRISSASYELLRSECSYLGIECAGYMEKCSRGELESRHLGLVMPGEDPDIDTRMDALVSAFHPETEVILDIALGAAEADDGYDRTDDGSCRADKVSCCADRGSCQADGREFELLLEAYKSRYSGKCVALAEDEAFSFSYNENLELLEYMGCEIRRFSPLRDECIPEGAGGLILWGGYPELYGEALSANESMRLSVKRAVEGGMPTLAECGGFMYLHDSLTDPEGKSHDMCQVIRGTCRFTGSLSHFGYQELHIKKDNPLAGAGEVIRAHEFHRSVSDAVCDGAVAVKGSRRWYSLAAGDTLFAGFAHINFLFRPEMAARFLEMCR